MAGTRITINSVDYIVGLSWQPADTWDDISHRIKETGLTHGVVIKKGKEVAGFGLIQKAAGKPWSATALRSALKPQKPPLSAAALLAALHPDHPVCAIERIEEKGVYHYWMSAVADGIVISGTDIILGHADVIRHIDEISEFGCKLTGGGSSGFGGDGEPTFVDIEPSLYKYANITRIGKGEAGKIAVLSVAVAAVGAMAWYAFKEPAQPVAPTVDTAAQASAKRRQAAIDARNAMLSVDLSGHGIAALAALADKGEGGMKGYEQNVLYWRMAFKQCSSTGSAPGSCTLTWQAESEYAKVDQIAAYFGIKRQQLAHDNKGDAVSLSIFPLDAGDRVVATEGTPLNGQAWQLVDACRRYNAETGRPGACVVADPQIVAPQDMQALPQGLLYRKGKVTIEGPTGCLKKLDVLFSQPSWMPWVRAEKAVFDYSNQTFKIEAHYVIQ